MSGAFVVRLGPGTDPSNSQFEGWIEVVDSGEELRFHSTEELLGVLGRHFYERYSDAAGGERR
jgi:hypothetical protein